MAFDEVHYRPRLCLLLLELLIKVREHPIVNTVLLTDNWAEILDVMLEV